MAENKKDLKVVQRLMGHPIDSKFEKEYHKRMISKFSRHSYSLFRAY